MKHFWPLLIIVFAPIYGFAQFDTSALKVSGYVDVFYSYDFNKNYSGQKQSFLTSYNLANQFALNHALMQAEYEKGITTLHIGLQAGSFVNNNYPQSYSILSEAYIDIKLNKSEKLTFSTGLFPSHLGFESAVAIDNIALSQSLAAENSPYYLFGARLDYIANDKWNLGLVLCNGWQQIELLNGSAAPAFGSYISFTPNNHWQVYWATYNGNITGYNASDQGFFNNFFIQFQKEKIHIVAGFDYGTIFRENVDNNQWTVTSFLLGYDASNKVSIGVRAEYLLENKNNITASPLPYLTETGIFGSSINVDFDINETLKFRIENRLFNANYGYFPKDGSLARNNNNITASISARF